MREEWSALEARNPHFAPAHPAAHDPVMRRPSDNIERVWVTNPPAARLLDLGNALYGHTLVLLQQAYAVEVLPERRGGIVAAAMTLAEIGSALGRMPAAEGQDGNAGLSFAVPRNLRSAPPEAAARLSLERLGELRSGAGALGLDRAGEVIDEAVLQLSEDPNNVWIWAGDAIRDTRPVGTTEQGLTHDAAYAVPAPLRRGG